MTGKILHNPVYAGNLTVAERPTKTMRSKKREYIPFAEREIVYGTHEPIIEQSRWDNVQKIMAERPPIIGDSTNGYDNIFQGLSNVLIVEVPCLQRWRTKESAIMFWTKPFIAAPSTVSSGIKPVQHITLRQEQYMR